MCYKTLLWGCFPGGPHVVGTILLLAPHAFFALEAKDEDGEHVKIEDARPGKEYEVHFPYSINMLIGLVFVLVGIYLSQKYASVKNN